MYLLIAGRFPFDDKIFDDGPNENYVGSPKMAEIHARLQRYKVHFGRSFDPYPKAKDLCKSMLEFDPNKRPDAAQALRHPWSRRAAAGRAQLLANFGRCGMGRLPRKCKLRGPCRVTYGTLWVRVHFARASVSP